MPRIKLRSAPALEANVLVGAPESRSAASISVVQRVVKVFCLCMCFDQYGRPCMQHMSEVILNLYVVFNELRKQGAVSGYLWRGPDYFAPAVVVVVSGKKKC